MKSKKIAGRLGLAGVIMFAAAAVISILMFERGVYSPINCFVTELGFYNGAFLTASSALVFNVGLMLSGLIFGVFMVIFGLRGNAPLRIAISFFGVLTGVLATAQGLFSLNFYTYHCIFASAFFVSLFIMCVLYIVSRMLSENRLSAPVQSSAAFFTGAAAALSAGYMITGGMAQVFAEDAAGIGRANVIPFAVIGWAAYALLLIFIAALSIRVLAGKDDSAKPKPASPYNKGQGNKGLQPRRKRSAETPAHTCR